MSDQIITDDRYSVTVIEENVLVVKITDIAVQTGGGVGTGTVTSVNGATPDESGDVTVPVPADLADLTDSSGLIPTTPADIGAAESSHNHNLANLAEKSYNSLTDKPSIPTQYTDDMARAAAPAETTATLKTLLEASTADTNPLGTDYVYGGRAGTIKTTWDNILLWLNTKYEALRTYSGGVIGTGVSLSTAISELDDALHTVEYPATSIAPGSWAVESGTVADLDSLTDSGMVFIEPAGVSNSGVEVWIDGVAHLTNMHGHYRYYSVSGTTNHSPTWKLFNTTLSGGSGDWEDTGVLVATNTSLIDVFNKVIENGDDYITDKTGVRRVKFRFDHPQTGSGNHRLLLKHVVASKGPVGVATSISHNALGGRDLADQHPTSAITGLDTALATKLAADALVDNMTGADGDTTHAPTRNAVFDYVAPAKTYEIPYTKAGNVETQNGTVKRIIERAGTVTAAYCTLGTVGSDDSTITVRKNGSSTVATVETNSTGITTMTLDVTSLAAGDYLTVNVTASATPAKDLSITLVVGV